MSCRFRRCLLYPLNSNFHHLPKIRSVTIMTSQLTVTGLQVCRWSESGSWLMMLDVDCPCVAAVPPPAPPQPDPLLNSWTMTVSTMRRLMAQCQSQPTKTTMNHRVLSAFSSLRSLPVVYQSTDWHCQSTQCQSTDWHCQLVYVVPVHYCRLAKSYSWNDQYVCYRILRPTWVVIMAASMTLLTPGASKLKSSDNLFPQTIVSDTNKLPN